MIMLLLFSAVPAPTKSLRVNRHDARRVTLGAELRRSSYHGLKGKLIIMITWQRCAVKQLISHPI